MIAKIRGTEMKNKIIAFIASVLITLALFLLMGLICFYASERSSFAIVMYGIIMLVPPSILLYQIIKEIFHL